MHVALDPGDDFHRALVVFRFDVGVLAHGLEQGLNGVGHVQALGIEELQFVFHTDGILSRPCEAHQRTSPCNSAKASRATHANQRAPIPSAASSMVNSGLCSGTMDCIGPRAPIRT